MRKRGFQRIISIFLICVVCVLSIPVAVWSASGLVAYYSFDGDVKDHSGNGYHGTNFEAVFVSGKSGKGLEFNGQTSYVTVPVDINPDVMPVVTMTAWAKPDKTNAIQTVISQDDGGYDRDLNIDYRGGGEGWSCFTGSGGVLGYREAAVDQWTFLAVVYDQPAEKVRLYVNNEVFEKDAVLYPGCNYLDIGRNPSYGEYFSGVIDEVCIFNYALSSSELAGVKSGQIPSYNPPATTASTGGGGIFKPVAYYPFNGDVKDYSGSGLHGENSGAEFVTGKYGQALKFNGANSYVSAPVNINPDVMPKLTITAWAKADKANAIQTIISQDNGNCDRALNIDYRGGGEGWSCFCGTGSVLGYKEVAVNQWTFLAVVYDQPAGKVRLYVNNEMFEKDGTIESGWDHVYIGKSPSFGEDFSGLIDEVMIFNQVLTTSEINSIKSSGPASVSATAPTSGQTATPPTPSGTPTTTPSPTVAATGSGSTTGSAGAVAYYPFDGDVKDYSGSGLHGENSGAVFVSGKYGQALKFDGASSFVSSPVNINPDVMPSMSMTAWVKADKMNAIQTVISQDDGGYDRGLNIDYRGGGEGWSCFTGSGGVLGYKEVAVDQWTFLAAVYDQPAEKVRLYVNNEVFEMDAVLYPGCNYINIGRSPSYGEYFSGVIDEVRIYDRALTSSEIGNIINSTLSPAVTPSQTPAATTTPAGTSRPTATAAAGVPSLIADSRTVAPGGNVQVPIRLENVKDFGSMNFVLTYDPKVLQVTRVDKGSLLSGIMFVPNFETPPVIRFGFAASRGISGSGSVAYVEFKAIGGAGESSSLTLSEVLAENDAGNPVSLRVSNGKVTIKSDRLLGDYNGDGRVTEVDALAALRMSVQLLAEDLIVDMDQNGKVTAEDARLILKQALAG
ncbi:MAG: hypothetical protein JXA46_09425 [Dehalococcoidales bacterium]|nr:hypothetical protein [Dehalococcoidales bacterium]